MVGRESRNSELISRVVSAPLQSWLCTGMTPPQYADLSANDMQTSHGCGAVQVIRSLLADDDMLTLNLSQ